MLAFISTAQAQGYLIQPSQTPAYVTQGVTVALFYRPGTEAHLLNPARRWLVCIPGQTPTYVTPRGNGAYGINRRGVGRLI